MKSEQHITIIRLRKPAVRSLNEELQWFGASLGLFSQRDKDKSCFRIFIELLKITKQGRGITSDEMAQKIGLSRGTVVHHLNKLFESGIVVHEGNKYFLRVNTLEDLVDELRKDAERSFDDLKTMARLIDKYTA